MTVDNPLIKNIFSWLLLEFSKESILEKENLYHLMI